MERVGRVEPLDAGNREAFFRLHSTRNDAGWCSCVAWWVDGWGSWGERTEQQNRCLRESLFDRGEHDGFLYFEGDEPLGWVQAGPRDRLAKLVSQFGLEPDPDCHALTCFLIAPCARRRGVAGRLLREVVALLRGRGVRRLEAFPRRGPELDTGDLWTGPEQLYLREGFRVLREDPLRPVLGLDL